MVQVLKVYRSNERCRTMLIFKKGQLKDGRNGAYQFQRKNAIMVHGKYPATDCCVAAFFFGDDSQDEGLGSELLVSAPMGWEPAASCSFDKSVADFCDVQTWAHIGTRFLLRSLPIHLPLAYTAFDIFILLHSRSFSHPHLIGGVAVGFFPSLFYDRLYPDTLIWWILLWTIIILNYVSLWLLPFCHRTILQR